MAVASLEIWTALSLSCLWISWNMEVACIRSNMSKLTRSFLLFLAVPMLLEELAHGHPIFHHSVQEVAFFITFPATVFHPKSADFLFSQAIVGLIIYGS